jgi:hypothetical protein
LGSVTAVSAHRMAIPSAMRRGASLDSQTAKNPPPTISPIVSAKITREAVTSVTVSRGRPHIAGRIPIDALPLLFSPSTRYVFSNLVSVLEYDLALPYGRVAGISLGVSLEPNVAPLVSAAQLATVPLYCSRTARSTQVPPGSFPACVVSGSLLYQTRSCILRGSAEQYNRAKRGAGSGANLDTLCGDQA